MILQEGHGTAPTDLILREVQQGLHVKPIQPHPLRPVVVAEALSRDVVVGGVVVVVLLAVEGLVHAVQGPRRRWKRRGSGGCRLGTGSGGRVTG
jgi:hypothetical protein